MEVAETTSRRVAAAEREVIAEETGLEVVSWPSSTAIRDADGRHANAVVVLASSRPAEEEAWRPDSNPYRHIVVALDGSELAEEILSVVVPLASAFGSRITLLRVVVPVQPPLYVGDMAGFSPRIDDHDLRTIAEQARLEASEYLAAHREQLEHVGLVATCRTPEGAPADSIVDYARAVGADLIAMTTHGRSGLGRLVFGSVADAVLRSAPCPVLLVRVEGT